MSLNMMDDRKPPDSLDRDHDRPAQSERSESSPVAGDASTDRYYYDDCTGYEVYDEDDDDFEEE